MKEFTKLLQAQFDKMCTTGKLFRSSISGQKVWETYLSSFEPKFNPIFRDPNSTTHNCNLCNNFIRRYGNIVAVNDKLETITIWDIVYSEEYGKVAQSISTMLKNALIGDVFFETFDELNSLPYESCSKTNSIFKLGIEKNVKRYTKEEAEKFGVVKPNEIRTFNHLHLSLPKVFVDMSGKSIESISADYRDAKNVFQRTMQEIPLDTLNLVKDLIVQGSLLDGQTHLYKVEQFIALKKMYDDTHTNYKDNWCWITSYKLPIAKFKNELIGVLCSELAEGEELNKACQSWNKRVDPANYMKAVAPITKKQIEDAKKFVEENGYEESFNRRFATIDDIKASEILHVNVGKGDIKAVSIFDNVKFTSTRHKRSEFDKVEEVSIEKFMFDILPTCTSVEAFLTNQHEGNLVSLTTANVKESKPIFKWSNNYSWTFNGNLAGKSQIKEAVKIAGGKVDGILRFSITWNEDGSSICDFDAHCKTPSVEIYYGHKLDYYTGGWLDVDMIRPSKLGVENITWQHKSQMKEGKYYFFNRNFDGGNNTGFKAEIEIEGEIFTYEKLGNLKGDTPVATVTLKNGIFTIDPHLPETHSSKELYGLESNNFHKVNLVCLSPNHWDTNNVGNKYYFFMLDRCKCPTSIRSFHAENLIPELAQHRKVLEVLGNTTMIEPADKQLSGLGFNATVRDELVVRLQGTHKRVIKLKF
jgi:hypothetical protein